MRERSHPTVYLCMGCHLLMGSFWPLDVVTADRDKRMLIPKRLTKFTDLYFAPLLDFDQWLGIPFAWVSPLHLSILKKHRPTLVTSCLLQISKEVRLLDLVAEAGFGDLKGGIITRLLQEEYAITDVGSMSEAEQLVKAVMSVKGCDDATACDFLIPRAAGADLTEGDLELLTSDLVQDRCLPIGRLCVCVCQAPHRQANSRE